MTADDKDKRPAGEIPTVVRISILGQEYPVRADADADYIREIAALLDARMRLILQAEPTRTPLKVAILTALNLTDEVSTLKREKQELIDCYERKVRRIHGASESRAAGIAGRRLSSPFIHGGSRIIERTFFLTSS